MTHGLPAAALAHPIITGAAALGTAAVLGTLAYGTFHPCAALWGEVVWRGDRSGKPRVTLTFDDGPTAPSTAQILDILRDMDVRATFFVIGQNVERQPDLVKRTHADGHIVGNHTLDHRHYGILRPRRFWEEQIARTDDLIEKLIGHRPALFRAPLGFKTVFTMQAARNTGHTVLAWSRRAFDGVATTTDAIVRRLVPNARPGDILTLHDGLDPHVTRDPAPTVSSIRPLIEGLRSRGLEIVALTELAGVGAYQS